MLKFASHGGSLVELDCDLLAVAVPAGTIAENEHVAALDKRLDGLLVRLATEEGFEGKPGQSLAVHTHGKLGAARILLVGAGAKDESQPRELAAVATRAAVKTGARHLAVVLPSAEGLQHAAEGALLGMYRFDRYLTGDEPKNDKKPIKLEQISVATTAPREVFDKLVRRAEIIAAAVAQTRDWVNEPAAVMTPRRLADEAQKIAKQHNLECTILGEKECRELGMGMYLAVSQGSALEPRFIHLVYRPKSKTKTVALVGKGITFDSGGLSLKPSQAMEDMKVDMAGSAAVINSIAAVAQLGLPVEVHAIAACCENMPSGSAYRLGDVLKSMNGKTVEINNTDAEGRLTLGDAITYALRQSPTELFDFATLTGACIVALGPHTAGVMSNDQALADRWLAAAKSVGDDMWQLPLVAKLKDQLKSEVADMRNTGERWGGAITAGIFLREFVGTTPWVHVDIAGPATSDKDGGSTAKGGTGFPVSTIVEYLSR